MEPIIASIISISPSWAQFLGITLGMLLLGWAFELLSGHVVATAALTGWTLHTGVQLQIKNVPGRKFLLFGFADNQAAGQLRILSYKLHDQSRGITNNVVASEVYPLFMAMQELEGSDTLIVQQSGSAVAGDVESGAIGIGYEGLKGRYIGIDEYVRRNTGIVFPVENTLSLGTAGGISGEEAINAESALGDTSADYALIGYNVSAECTVIRWRGIDTYNLPVGGPGNDTNKDLTNNWFLWCSRFFGIPMIPVFNFSNQGGILIDGIQDENGTDVTVNSIFVKLAGRSVHAPGYAQGEAEQVPAQRERKIFATS